MGDLLNGRFKYIFGSQSNRLNYSEARHKMLDLIQFPLFNCGLVRNARPG